MSIDDEWIKNMRYLNTVECNSVLKKEGNPATCDNMMNLEDIILSEISQ